MLRRFCLSVRPCVHRMRDGPVGVVFSIPYAWDHGKSRCNSLRVNLTLEKDVLTLTCVINKPIPYAYSSSNSTFKVEYYRARVCYSNVGDKYYKTARVLHAGAFISVEINHITSSSLQPNFKCNVSIPDQHSWEWSTHLK